MRALTGDRRDERRHADGRPGAEPGGVGRDEGASAADAPAARGRFEFERGWMVVAGLLLVAAASLLYLGWPSAAFVAAALGISAWFLNVRNGLKRKHDLVKRGPRDWVPRGRGED